MDLNRLKQASPSTAGTSPLAAGGDFPGGIFTIRNTFTADEAVTKRFIDLLPAIYGTTVPIDLTAYLDKAGTRTMTGALGVTGAVTTSTHAVTLTHADTQIASATATALQTSKTNAVNAHIAQIQTGGLSVPVGTVMRFPLSIVPTGYLRTNGAVLSKTTYASLYAVTGDIYSTRVPVIDYTSYGCVGGGRPWQIQYDFNKSQKVDLEDWSVAGYLISSTMFAGVTVTKNKIYLHSVTSAYGSSTAADIVAPIAVDGTIGAFQQIVAGSGAPYVKSIVTKNRVYLLGGVTPSHSAPVDNVYTAPIDSNGTIGTWAAAAALPVASYRSEFVLTKNRIYMIGGLTAGAIYSAPVDSNGLIGTWVLDGALPAEVMLGQVVSTQNRVFYIGGAIIGVGNVSTVYSAPINSDGTLGAWSLGSPISVPTAYAQAFCTKNKVYLAGGIGGTGTKVYAAPINTDGTLGGWVYDSELPSFNTYATLAVIQNNVYIFGGGGGGYANENSYKYIKTRFSGGTSDYSSFYSGAVNTFTGVNIPSNTSLPALPGISLTPTTHFALADSTLADSTTPGVVSYVKT